MTKDIVTAKQMRRRWPRLPKPTLGVTLGLLAACGFDPNVVHYCDQRSGDKMTLNLSTRMIGYTSLGVTDQSFPMTPCSDRLETCFISVVGFVHPFETPIRRHPFLLSAERRGAGRFAITTGTSGYGRSSYEIGRGQRLPRTFRLEVEGEERSFERCWLPFGPSPFT